MGKTNRKNNKKLNTSNMIPQKRLKLVLIISLIAFFVLTLRLLYIQFVQGEYLSSLAISQQTKSEVISSKRGNIYDSTGLSLAITETVDTISINPGKLVKKTDADTKEYKELVAKGLAKIFNLEYKDVLKKVNSTSSVETIIKKVEKDKVTELKNWMKENKISVGINIDEDFKRYYPNSTLASQVIGSCGTDNQGLSGIEYSYDSILTGVSGQIVTSKDASKGEIPNSVESFVAAENGYNLTLTIDANIQKIVEKHLKQAVEDNNCKKGATCIMMDPSNGEILAMASYPDFDLNDPTTPTSYYEDDWEDLSSSARWERIYNMWSVRPVSEMYEPGSVFKLITASVALEENIVTEDKTEFSCTGSETVSKNASPIRCWVSPNSHGNLSLREALEFSCNPALIQLGRKIGATTLYKYYDAFGFFNKTNVGLSGEGSGVFHKLEEVGPVELATMSFGQRFTITPLQMATALCAIVNGGNLLQPKIVKSMTNTDTGEIIEQETKVIRQVISSQTSSKMRDMMLSVVEDGTGKNARIEGYSVGGKSGTSEPISGNKDSYYIASFAAITPVENTKLVTLVALHDPNGVSHQGGTVAAPVTQKILSEVLPYLGIEPDQN